MGKVKSFYHDEICARANEEPDQEPDDLELLKIDAEQAWERYQNALAKYRATIREKVAQIHREAAE